MTIEMNDVFKIAFVLSVVVEVAPIKINPWKWLAKSIGKALNADLTAQVKGIRSDFDAYKEKTDERYANSCRTRIIRCADEARHGIRHSKEFWDQALSDIDDYERYCRAHPEYKNNKAVQAIEKILNLYREEDWI